MRFPLKFHQVFGSCFGSLYEPEIHIEISLRCGEAYCFRSTSAPEVVPEQLPGDDHPADLRRARADIPELLVEVVPGDGIFRAVAIPPVDLDGVCGDLRPHLPAEQEGGG